MTVLLIAMLISIGSTILIYIRNRKINIRKERIRKWLNEKRKNSEDG